METCFSLPRLQVSKTHFRGGGCFDASPPSVAGAGPEWTHRCTEARTNRGTHTSCCGLHTRHSTAVDLTLVPIPYMQNIHFLTHEMGAGFTGCCPQPTGSGIFPASEVSGNLKSCILRSPGHELVCKQVPSPQPFPSVLSSQPQFPQLKREEMGWDDRRGIHTD